MCFDDAGRQPDGAVFEVGSWQVFATGVYVCMCGEPDGTVDERTRRICVCVCVGETSGAFSSAKVALANFV